MCFLKTWITQLIRRVRPQSQAASFEYPEPEPLHPLLEPLSDEQRSAITADDRRLLVLAGAGSGKTRTLTTKIAHLIDTDAAQAKSIVAITFTRAAAEDMKEKLIAIFDPAFKEKISDPKLSARQRSELTKQAMKPHAWIEALQMSTFHSFAYSILRKHNAEFGDNLKIIDQRDYDYDAIEGLGRTTETQMSIILGLIREHARDPKYLFRLKRWILSAYTEKRSYSSKNPRSTNYQKPYLCIDGTTWVRSKSERMIADWLYEHGIEYEYEREIQPGSFSFKPDFYLPAANLYLEHQSDLSSSMEAKAKEFRRAGLGFIITREDDVIDKRAFFQDLSTRLLPQLNRELTLDDSRPYETEMASFGGEVEQFSELVRKVIDKTKVELLDFDEVIKRGEEHDTEQVSEFYSLIKGIVPEYLAYCKRKGYIDYNDMINHAVELLENHASIRNAYRRQIDYLLVDEYQDVNTGQVRLLKAILDDKAQLFCVGDDWQSIYGWRGSDLRYIVDFANEFENATIKKLTMNYRSTDTIVQAGNEVIKKNRNQIDKTMKSLDKDAAKITLVQVPRMENAADFITTLSDPRTMILYRKRKHREVFDRNIPKGIDTRTIHRAKGLEADRVIILAPHDFGIVPSELAILQVVKPQDYELVEEEERRLFYVALTRARKEVILITEKGNHCQYIDEIPKEYLENRTITIESPEANLFETYRFDHNAASLGKMNSDESQPVIFRAEQRSATGNDPPFEIWKISDDTLSIDLVLFGDQTLPGEGLYFIDRAKLKQYNGKAQVQIDKDAVVERIEGS